MEKRKTHTCRYLIGNRLSQQPTSLTITKNMTASIQCHYDILNVPRDADTSTIKKAHRKKALQFHPDKNFGDDSAAEQFRLVQQAYECLSDSQERKWYDDHREAILAGWSSNSSETDTSILLFNVVPFMHPGCYSGYDNDDKGSFYSVYSTVFDGIVQCERKQADVLIELPTDIGSGDSEWSFVQNFYQHWESFVSALNFAWEDKYNVMEDAPSRRVRRLMEDDNKKARRAAKKTYNQDILALVSFVKRRDPRVKAKQEEMEFQKIEQQKQQKIDAEERKKEQQRAKEAWKEEAALAMLEAEEEDRLAGRVRLADLEDDYDYGGGKKKKGKKKKKSKQNFVEEEEEETDIPAGDGDAAEQNGEAAEATPTEDDAHVENGTTDKLLEDDDEKESVQNGDSPPMAVDDEEEQEAYAEDTSSSEEEPDSWRCECCKKDFKSGGQMENHMKSKKHKQAFKKYEAKLKKQEEELLLDMMDDVAIS